MILCLVKEYLNEGDILDLASKIGVIVKSGAWYAYNGEKIGQGRENAKIYLREHEAAMNEIEKKVREHFSSHDEESESEEHDNGKVEE